MSIAAEQSYELVPIDALRAHPQNPNEGDVGAVAESIETNSFYGAVYAQRSSGFIVAGNHRWAAARQLGLQQIPVIWLDIDDSRALRILAVDNRSTRLGIDNQVALVELLASLAQEAEGLAGTGYDGDDLDAMLARLNADDEQQGAAVTFNVSVRCSSREEQQATLTKLLADGLDAHAS